MTLVIETTGLTKHYGEVTAAKDVDLVVEEGEVFGFLGHNGAGKSTTIDMLLGFLKPTEGRATVLGHDATDESRAVRARVGLLPEGYGLYENLSARDHIASAIETKDADDAPDAIIERVGLDPAEADRAVGGYSKGMQQRTALGVALVGEPDLLILDEPSSGLDPGGMELLRRIVREEAERGATVFFSSHILGQVEQVCDRVGIMDGGELVAVDTIEDLHDGLGMSSVVEATVEVVPDPASLRSVEGVSDVAVAGDAVRVTCTERTAKMRALRRLDERTTVLDVAVEDGSLESLFEEYTREGAPAADDGPDESAVVAGGAD